MIIQNKTFPMFLNHLKDKRYMPFQKYLLNQYYIPFASNSKSWIEKSGYISLINLIALAVLLSLLLIYYMIVLKLPLYLLKFV